MSKSVDFEKYAHFVNAVTSEESKDCDMWVFKNCPLPDTYNLYPSVSHICFTLIITLQLFVFRQ